jgi:hypothetical protein
MQNSPAQKAIDILRERFPTLSESKLIEADERFGRYLELAIQIYEAICADPERYKKFEMTIAKNAGEEYNPSTPSP